MSLTFGSNLSGEFQYVLKSTISFHEFYGMNPPGLTCKTKQHGKVKQKVLRFEDKLLNQSQSKRGFFYLFDFDDCRDLRLVLADDVISRPEAMELAFFQNLMMRHIEIAKDTLLKK